MAKKLPALHFYPGDWFKDPGIMALNYGERGIWFQMLLLMFESKKRGYLILNGAPYPLKDLSRIFNIPTKLLGKIIEKLIKLDIVSVQNSTKILYCRRMIKDEEIRQAQSIGGVKGSEIKKEMKGLPKENPSGSSEDEVEDEKVLGLNRKELIFQNRWQMWEGEKNDINQAQEFWNAKIHTQTDVENYDKAVLNYYAILTHDRNNGFPLRKVKGGKTWFNTFENYIDQQLPSKKPVDGIQPPPERNQNQLQEKCVSQLEFVQEELDAGETREYQWFHMALDKLVVEYEQRFGGTPFDDSQSQIYQVIREEMIAKEELT